MRGLSSRLPCHLVAKNSRKRHPRQRCFCRAVAAKKREGAKKKRRKGSRGREEPAAQGPSPLAPRRHPRAPDSLPLAPSSSAFPWQRAKESPGAACRAHP